MFLHKTLRQLSRPTLGGQLWSMPSIIARTQPLHHARPLMQQPQQQAKLSTPMFMMHMRMRLSSGADRFAPTPRKMPPRAAGKQNQRHNNNNNNNNNNKSLQRRDDQSRKPRSRDPGPLYASRVITVGSVRKTTKKGRTQNFRALVVSGNMNGAGGFAVGKGSTVRKAIQNAYKGSLTRWIAIPLSEDRGIHHDVKGEKNNTIVMLRKTKPYRGIVSGKVVQGIAECMGIETLTSKVFGRRTPATVVYATFHAFSQMKSPEEIAEKTGREFIRVSKWAPAMETQKRKMKNL